MGALVEGDSVGMNMFNERVVANVRPFVGRQQLYVVLRSLVNPKNYGGRCDYSAALKETSSVLASHSILMIVSDFIGLKEEDKRILRMAARKYDLAAFIIRDPRDGELPSGLNLVTVSDPYSGEQLVIDVEKVRDAYAAEAKKELNELEAFFKSSRIDYVLLDTSKPFIEPLVGFFRRRQQKIK